MRLNKAHRVLDGDDLLGRIVGNLAAELFLERHHQLDRVQAVSAQIIDKARVFSHLGIVDAKVLDDDLLDPLGDVAFIRNFLDLLAMYPGSTPPKCGRFP